MTKIMREVECWTCFEDAELLQTSIEDAVDEYISIREEGDIPEELVVYPFVRMRLPDPAAYAARYSPLEYLMESLDEEFANPDGRTDDNITPAMREAEAAFVAAVFSQYKVWMCERAGDPIVVKVADYL